VGGTQRDASWTVRSVTIGGLALALLTPPLMSACRQVLGVEQRNDGPPLLSLGEACDACVASACDDAERACAGEPACVKLVQCMTGAGLDRPIERVACATEHAEGLTASSFGAIDECLRVDCQDACLARDGFFAGKKQAPEAAYPDECHSCMTDHCLKEMSACVADADCEKSAVAALGEPAEINPATMGALTTLRERVAEYDLGVCVGANSDGDAGACGEPLQPEPVAGFRLDACGGSVTTFPCEPIKTFETQADGFASGSLPLAPLLGFRGYLRVTEGASLVQMDPVHVFAGGPVTGDGRGGNVVFPENVIKRPVDEGNRCCAGPGTGHAHPAVLDCSTRFARGIEARRPAKALIGATPQYVNGASATVSSGIVIVWNTVPGCYDVGGTRDDGSGPVETHRMRITVVPGVTTWAYLSPKNDSPEDVVHPCEPDFVLPN